MNVLFKSFLSLSVATVSSIACAQQKYCNPSITPDTPTERFTINADDTVTDKVTGLAWKRCSVGQNYNAQSNSCDGTASQHNWKEALTLAQQAGNDWRLPNIKELSSIVERRCYGPAINPEVFPGTESATYWSSSATYWSSYWSSSPDASNTSYAWVVDFILGSNYGYVKYTNSYVRLVRGGQ